MNPNMKKYLFLFTISPVQSFIAQARKTQDLYAGSRILSDIMTQSINLLTNAEVIYPKLTSESATHRVLAVVETEDIKQYAENFIEKIWKYIFDEIYKEVLNLPISAIQSIKDTQEITRAINEF